MSKSAASEDAYQFIYKHLQECETSPWAHENCTTGAFMPTRLVEISGPETFRVVQLPSATATRYTALSYCWGSGSFFKATKSTIYDLGKENNFCELPAVLRDAITITHKLGVTYIWIDALCIIQDDVSDWERESSSMGSIYEEAYLTIAASSSPSVHVPFLNCEFATKSACLQLEVPGMPEGTDLNIRARQRPLCGVHASYDNSDPWRRRAWAFQEQQLSTRLICFTPNELQWRCKLEPNCECGDVKSTVDWEFPWREPSSLSLTELSDFWHNAVFQYSSRDMTFPNDKLPAISGLVKWMSEWRVQDVYLAGLWKSTLINDMCWHRDAGAFTGTLPWVLPRLYRAPSFSWASVDGLVGYWHREKPIDPVRGDNERAQNVYPVAEVIEVECGFEVTLGRQHNPSRTEHVYHVRLDGAEIPFNADVNIDVVTISGSGEAASEIFGIRAGSQEYLAGESSQVAGVSYSRLTPDTEDCRVWLLKITPDAWGV
ncbi:hypothetical protein PG997_007295 [Apiospora hydei]|uniref:Heterokaryon incompatibility domain-containing protein n=1 Tax=Apiospora hydei TaxID=1337664 RepID=A0ABR1W8V7_9PEZI